MSEAAFWDTTPLCGSCGATLGSTEVDMSIRHGRRRLGCSSRWPPHRPILHKDKASQVLQQPLVTNRSP
jgi:hypothetical protein